MNRITRSLLSAGTLAVLLPLAPVPAMAATLDKPGATAISFATDYDRVIDAVVAQRVAMKQLTPAQALVAREQMQIQFVGKEKGRAGTGLLPGEADVGQFGDPG